MAADPEGMSLKEHFSVIRAADQRALDDRLTAQGEAIKRAFDAHMGVHGTSDLRLEHLEHQIGPLDRFVQRFWGVILACMALSATVAWLVVRLMEK